jgi:hypothetical protein
MSNIYSFSTATMIRECASMLHYTYIACLVKFTLCFTSRKLSVFYVEDFSKMWCVSFCTSHVWHSGICYFEKSVTDHPRTERHVAETGILNYTDVRTSKLA